MLACVTSAPALLRWYCAAQQGERLLLEIWRGRDSGHASLVLLVQLLLLQHLLRTANAAPVSRLPFVTHHLLHILQVCVGGACGPKVIHHVTMLCSDVRLTQAAAKHQRRNNVLFRFATHSDDVLDA